jgi:hypothetical protein
MIDIKDFADEVFDNVECKADVDKGKVKAIVDYFFTRVVEEIRLNNIVTIPKFGTFSPSKHFAIRFFPHISIKNLKKELDLAKLTEADPVKDQ